MENGQLKERPTKVPILGERNLGRPIASVHTRGSAHQGTVLVGFRRRSEKSRQHLDAMTKSRFEIREPRLERKTA